MDCKSRSRCIENEKRHGFNRLDIERFAAERNQKVSMFAASHNRPQGNSSISVASMLIRGDGGEFTGPGIFFFTRGMPVMLLENILTSVNLVNGRIGTAVGVVVDPKAEFYEVGDRYILSSLPPACVLVEYDQPTGLDFEGLAPNVQPFFPTNHFGEIKDLTEREVSVRRWQVPLTPAFAITEYKAQGRTRTMDELGIDLNFDGMIHMLSHYKWTSLNLQLGRTMKFTDICLHDPITSADVKFRPDESLAQEIARLEQLALETEQRWRDLLGN